MTYLKAFNTEELVKNSSSYAEMIKIAQCRIKWQNPTSF